jgi:hypothetical protein
MAAPEGDNHYREFLAKIRALIDRDEQEVALGRGGAANALREEAAEYTAMSSDPDDLTDAKIAASEARTETKIVRMEGKLDLVVSKLDSLREDNRATRANQWVIGFGLAVLIVAVAALFPVFFDMGGKVKDWIREEVRTASSPAQKAQ